MRLQRNRVARDVDTNVKLLGIHLFGLPSASVRHPRICMEAPRQERRYRGSIQ